MRTLVTIAFFFSTLALANIGPNVTIKFENGQTALTREAKDQLTHIVNQARSQGKIDEIEIAAWSDNPTPRESDNLSKTDRNIASKRAKNVQNYLKSTFDISDVDTYNMAERANWLAKLLDTPEAELKSEMQKADENMSREKYKVFKDNGGASKAVIIVKMEK